MSSSGGFGSTLTGGIQDISAILPLLGTEQCSDQAGSALTRGYLYAASAPMSIFGSLGVVNAGFKTLVACISFRKFDGAKILGNMGFEPRGENLSLIMVEPGKGKDAGHYIIEKRMDQLIKELNIDKKRITGVSHKPTAWNIKMIATTALLCAFSITPYIHLNLSANNLNNSTRWLFPALRATGGFLTATLIQLLIQRRITTLSHQYLVNRDQSPQPPTSSIRDPEAADPGDTKKHQMDARTWLSLFFLLIGILASVAGYVGCFSVVQSSTSTTGPVSWLCLEAGLSLVRLAIWAWNPKKDDAPPLEIILELDEYEHKPLPTCNKDNDEILRCKVLPLTRAREFLKIITSFAGLIEPFVNPDLSLYYTLTRNRDNEPEDAKPHELGERTLYITVFDHKERTTRVYTRDKEIDTFYSTKSDAPLVDVGHFLLEVEIDAKIDPKGDPVSSDGNNLDSLRKHHRSILEQIQYRLGAIDKTRTYVIENSWTMKVEDTISTLQRLREENEDDWKTGVEKGKEEERNEESSAIHDYFMHSSIERERRLLDEKRVKWIARGMKVITEELNERYQLQVGAGVECHRVNGVEVEKAATNFSELIERIPSSERYMMELLLLYEVTKWEELFWKKLKTFLDQIGNNRLEEKEKLRREWRADCWKRLNPQMHAAKERCLKERDGVALGKRWASSISQIFEGKLNSKLPSELKAWIEHHQNDEICLRMGKEIEDTEFRLKRGSELARFDQFWDDDTLFKCRYSRSKWLYLRQYLSTAPFEILSHALKGNKNIIHITFSYLDSDSDVNRFQATIRDLPWVTSICRDSSQDLFERPPAIQRDLLYINNDLNGLPEELQLELDSDPFSTYIFTDARGSEMSYSEKIGIDAKVFISFVAPESDKTLTLRLKHSGDRDTRGVLEVTLGTTAIELHSSQAPVSLTIDDITLYPNHRILGPSGSNPDQLSFKAGTRNEIVIGFSGPDEDSLFLYDIELLDEAGLAWGNRILNVD